MTTSPVKQVPKKYNPLVGLVLIAIGCFAWYIVIHGALARGLSKHAPDYVWDAIPACFILLGLAAVLEKLVGDFMTWILLFLGGTCFFTPFAWMFLGSTVGDKPYIPVALAACAYLAYYFKFKRY